MCNIYPRKKFPPLFLGSLIEATGITVLAWALCQGHIPTTYGMMALTGCGTGLRFMPGSLHVVGFFLNDISLVMTMTSFAVPLGSTLAMTIMDSVFNDKIGLRSASASLTISSTYIQPIFDLLQDVQDLIIDNAKLRIVYAFISVLPFKWLCVVESAGLGNVNITTKKTVDEKGNRDFSENVTEGAF